MPDYQRISVVATSLHTDEETLRDFQRKGWIQAVERHDVTFLAADQRYRAKYILYLHQTRRLSEEQIQLVLSNQRPPYSAAEVDEILNHHSPASASSNAGS